MTKFNMDFGTVQAFRLAQIPERARDITKQNIGNSNTPNRRAQVVGAKPTVTIEDYSVSLRESPDGRIIPYINGMIAGSAGRDLHNVHSSKGYTPNAL